MVMGCSAYDKEAAETGHLTRRQENVLEVQSLGDNSQEAESEVDRRGLGRQSRKMSKRLTGCLD